MTYTNPTLYFHKKAIMNSPQRLKALFFDFDGVLADSTRIKTRAFEILFKDFPDEIIDQVVQHHQLHGGISRVDKIRYAHETIIGTPLTESQVKQWAARYSDLVVQKVIDAPWIKGARPFLAEYSGKVPVFLISGTPEPELKYVLEQRKMSACFTEILGSPVRKPAHIQRLLAEYRLAPAQCLFIGDALTDQDAASRTGLYFIGIQGEVDFPKGTRVLPDCRGLKAALEQIFS